MECGRFLSVRLPIPVEGPFSSKMQTHKMKISRITHRHFGEYNVIASRGELGGGSLTILAGFGQKEHCDASHKL